MLEAAPNQNAAFYYYFMDPNSSSVQTSSSRCCMMELVLQAESQTIGCISYYMQESTLLESRQNTEN